MGNVLPLPMSSATSLTKPDQPSAVVLQLLPPQVRDRLLPVTGNDKAVQLPDRVCIADAESGVVVRTVIKVHGEDRVRNALMIALAETIDSMNCTQPGSSSWIRLFVNDWISKYPCETLEDFVLFLEGVRTGKFGPLYNGRVDGARLFELFGKYMAEKTDYRERLVLREREEAIQRRDQHFAEAQMSWEEREKVKQQVDGLKRIATAAALDRATTDNPRIREHRTAGFKAAEDASTAEDLILAMSIYPYDDVQAAISDRAQALGIQLPTREEFIAAARERARNHRR